MSGSLWQENARAELLDRVQRLTPDARGRWGKLHCPAMMAHVNDGLRMPLGEVVPPQKQTLMRHFPLKQLIIYLLPWPKGVPTSPMLLARSDVAVFAEEVAQFRQLLPRLAALGPSHRWPPHPAFGTMNRRLWGALGYRHIDHHFRQFGV